MQWTCALANVATSMTGLTEPILQIVMVKSMQQQILRVALDQRHSNVIMDVSTDIS